MSTATIDRVIEQRERHHEALKQMLPKSKQINGAGLQTWRKLRRIEARANVFALRLCNGPEMSENEQDTETEAITAAVAVVFGGAVPKGFFVNRDPRGYALKLEPGSVPFALHEDWGRYQILAPEIN